MEEKEEISLLGVEVLHTHAHMMSGLEKGCSDPQAGGEQVPWCNGFGLAWSHRVSGAWSSGWHRSTGAH